MSNVAEFTLEIGDFRGPLELLLDLIEQRKLHVNDISLAQVSDDYIHYIQQHARVQLAETSQFIVVASTLLLIKSRSLLPTIELSNDEEQDIRDLEHRLQLYAQARLAARHVKRMWGKKLFLPARTPMRPIVFAPARDSTPKNFCEAAQRLIDALPTFTKVPTARIAREIRIEDIIESLAARMRDAFEGSFKKLTSGTNKVEAVVSFLALLELIKRGTLSVNQQGNFEDITMRHDTIDTPHYG